MPRFPIANFRNAPMALLRPVPVKAYDPLLEKISTYIARRHPKLFNRLGDYASKTYLIRFTNLPFVMVLKPNPEHVEFKAYRSEDGIEADATITGSFLNLFRLLDGQMDGDAIFFSRDLKVEGDTEAVVRLRNALDDVDGSIVSDVADFFGPFGRIGLSVLRRIEV